MTLATVQVLLTCRTPQGQAVPQAKVRLKLTHTEVDGALVVPLLIEATADNQGDCLLDLWPNERSTQGSQYQVSIATPADAGGNLLFVGHISVPAALPISQPVPFELLTATHPFPRVSATEAALARLQAAEVGIAASIGLSAQHEIDALASATAAAAQALLATSNGQAQVALAAQQALLATSNGQAQVVLATAQTGAAATSASAANTQAGMATTQANAALAQAGAAAASALSAASVLQQDLSGFTGQLHLGGAVAMVIYDTSTDSDNGAWTQSRGAASWATEPLSGAWLGRAANEAAARALPGAATGAYYQNSTDNKFYRLSAGAGQTETFRGNKATYPRLAGVVLETQRVVTYDLSQAGRPMWDVWQGGAGEVIANTAGAGALTCIAAAQGRLYIGTSTRSLGWVDYASDRAAVGFGLGVYNIAQRPGAARNTVVANVGAQLFYAPNVQVNAIALATLPGASPTHPGGLPAPTAALGGNGGPQIIRPLGSGYTAVTSAATAVNQGISIGPAPGYLVGWLQNGGSLGQATAGPLGTLAASFSSTPLNGGAVPDARGFGNLVRPSTRGDERQAALWSDGSAQIYRGNPLLSAGGMLARIAADHATGWMFSGNRRTYLASFAAGAVSAAQLIANPDFTVDTSGWTPSGGATLSVVSGELQITSTGAAPSARATIATVVGRGYVIEATTRRGTSSQTQMGVVEIASALDGYTATSNTTYRLGFIATATSHTITIGSSTTASGTTSFFDAVTVRPAGDAVGYFRQPLELFGTLTSAAVSTTAQLTAWSGFSALNYLQEPYSAQLDLGLNPVTISAWARMSALQAGTIIERSAASGASINLAVNGAGQIVATVFDGTTTRTATSAQAYPVGAWLKVRLNYTTTSVSVVVNGVQVATTTGAAMLTLNNTAAVVTVGNNRALDSAFSGSLCLVKISQGVPTTEQALYMYQDEQAMFVSGAQVGLPTSAAPVDCGFDAELDLTNITQPAHQSRFSGLVRVGLSTPSSGSFTKSCAGAGGVELLARGASGVDVILPAQGLREELVRMRESAQAPEVFDITAVAAQTLFPLPPGYTAVQVLTAGVLKREGASADYVRQWDGFREAISFAVAPGASAWVQITARRFA